MVLVVVLARQAPGPAWRDPSRTSRPRPSGRGPRRRRCRARPDHRGQASRARELGQERAVGVEPVDVVELVGAEPADGVVLVRDRVAVDERGEGDRELVAAAADRRPTRPASGPPTPRTRAPRGPRAPAPPPGPRPARPCRRGTPTGRRPPPGGYDARPARARPGRWRRRRRIMAATLANRRGAKTALRWGHVGRLLRLRQGVHLSRPTRTSPRSTRSRTLLGGRVGRRRGARRPQPQACRPPARGRSGGRSTGR